MIDNPNMEPGSYQEDGRCHICGRMARDIVGSAVVGPVILETGVYIDLVCPDCRLKYLRVTPELGWYLNTRLLALGREGAIEQTWSEQIDHAVKLVRSGERSTVCIDFAVIIVCFMAIKGSLSVGLPEAVGYATGYVLTLIVLLIRELERTDREMSHIGPRVRRFIRMSRRWLAALLAPRGQ